MDAYVPLWVKSYHSFLQGASSPEELVEEAKALGLSSLAVTDRDGVYGAVPFPWLSRSSPLISGS